MLTPIFIADEISTSNHPNRNLLHCDHRKTDYLIHEERSLKLDPGKYFGDQLAQRSTPGVLLTLCRYRPEQALPNHVHSLPGFFFLIAGDHREANQHGDRAQPETTLIYHEHNDPHETTIGPLGMTGLNIAFQHEWLFENEAPSILDKSGYMLGRPIARTLALKLLTGLLIQPDCQLESTALELIASMWECGRQLEAHPPTWLRAARQTIEEDFSEALSLSSLARAASVHPVYLARTFRMHYGCSVTDYIHQVRLAHAFGKILDGQSIGEAAAECGFYDHAYLTKLARARFGIAPSELNWFRSSKQCTALVS